MNIMDFLKLDETPSRLDKMGDAFLEDNDALEPEEALELFADLIEAKPIQVIDHVNNHTQFRTEKFFKAFPEKRKEL